ncbi:SctL family type III secretion system stator protein BscL [Bordetella bronchiseptica]|uniref:SctL family type III secretion system stator protein BscL n=1 Tax=Bordetella bronchiseptica TaxID=518 RepID=UPI000460C381|nr:SctL family type III secretion system stator protein BscL [Bordetella bronchiseptica]KDD26739.1 type III secretion apparatus protein, HrpE/YscL family [Bordetella bronchiseptica MBORD782]VTQ88920.1 type III secretion system protein [Bordetella bronchiseptica]
MAFLVPRPSLIQAVRPGRADPATDVLRAEDYAELLSAAQIVAQAHRRADEIVAEAREEFERERRRGYEEGRREALTDQAEKMIETVSRTIDYFAGIENEMIELVMSAVRKIVDGYDDRERTVIAVRNALAVVRNQRQMTLRLHPDEVDVLREGMNQLLAAYPGVGYLDLLPDARLTRGACILESEIGMVEASLEDQLCALRAAFERTFGRRG